MDVSLNYPYFIIKCSSKMIKQGKKGQSSASESFISATKTMKAGQNVPKEVLQFLVRQLTVLKDIAESHSHTHPDIITSRLHQCVHLMEKKLWFSLGDNPEQYHDYIQDFYENQINSLRSQLNISKIQAANRKRELDQLRLSYQNLLREKQTNFLHLETSRVSKSGASLEYCEQNTKLKSQLDHCRILLLQNTQLIEEQAKAIQNLSIQLKLKQKQHKTLREEHDRKICQFDDYINKFKSRAEGEIKMLAAEHKNYQAQLKQITLMKLRLMEERSGLQKQLETKVEEIQLLTKKILDDEVVINKYERTISLKQNLIEELYQEIDSANGYLSKYGKKEGDYQKMCNQKNQQIVKLEQRIKVINQTSEKLEKKFAQITTKMQELQHQNERMQKEIQSFKTGINDAQKQNEILKRKLEHSQKLCLKLGKQKESNEKQIKLIQERYRDLHERSASEKLIVKKEILTEVNQLVELVKQKQQEAKVLKEENNKLKDEIQEEKNERQYLQENSAEMNQLMAKVQSKITFLQNQNLSLIEAKTILEEEIEKMNSQIVKLAEFERKYADLKSDYNKAISELESLRKRESEVLANQNTKMSEVCKRESELEQVLGAERKQMKELTNKKDFQIRQLESKVKILQEEVREGSKIFETEKLKMGLKVKELQELLKERYDFSSRFSQQSEGN